MSFLLLSHPLTSLSASSSSSSSSSNSSCSTWILTSNTVYRLRLKPTILPPKSFNGVRFHNSVAGQKVDAVIVKASESDGIAATENSEPSSEGKEKVVQVDKLPLESKLQEKTEQKIRMKLAKKIRLRRKRLVRKRRLRKKGRWPPSKMNKLKNV